MANIDIARSGAKFMRADGWIAFADAVEAVIAEVERLRADNHELRLMAEEAAHAENLNAKDLRDANAEIRALQLAIQLLLHNCRTPTPTETPCRNNGE